MKFRADGKPMIANTDGACSHNPGGAVAAGFVLRDGTGRQLAARGFFVTEIGSSNMGELVAVAKAGEAAREHGATSLRVYSDSQLAVMLISGRWRARAPHIEELRDEALVALDRLPHWIIEWIPRERNRAADAVCANVLRAKADVDYGDREILEPVPARQARRPARRQRFTRKRPVRESIYPSECFRTGGVENGPAYRQTIREKQLRLRNTTR